MVQSITLPANRGCETPQEHRDMHNTLLIRQICGKISREKDKQKIDDLLLLLNSVILNDIEDARVRMEFIRRKYSIAFAEEKAGSIPGAKTHD